MRIVTGRGSRRTTHLDIPCAEIVNRSNENEIKAVGGMVCRILGIKEDVDEHAQSVAA